MALTVAEFNAKLERIRLKIQGDDVPLRLASYSALAMQAERIFTQGKNSNGEKIGDYSTKDIWVLPTVGRNKGGFNTPPTGKTGKGVFESGKKAGQPHKTQYFKGWKGLREKQGLETAFVNLQFTDDLFLDFTNPQGSIPTTREVTNHEYVTSLKRTGKKGGAANADKLRGNEKRFNCDIGRLTKEEKAEFYKTARFELRKILAEG